MKFLLPFLLSCSMALGATFYVSTTGNNGNPGTVGSPWRNIWYAANNVLAGSTVNVASGTYNEFVTNTVSGTPGNEITFIGSANWTTIIDPSTDLSTGWVAAPEVGSGAWKNTAPFTTHELTISGKRVAFVSTTNTLNSAPYATNYFTTGSQMLALSSSATCKPSILGIVVPWWDGIEALWSAAGTTTFLRLRNGSDPNGLSIRVAPNSGALYNASANLSAVRITASNIVYRGFQVRGGVGGFQLYGDGARDNLIESNLVANGCAGIQLTGNDIVKGASRNTIRGNTVTTDWYGGTNYLRAWIYGKTAALATAENIYNVSKYYMGNLGSLDDRIYLLYAGDSNVITGNICYQSVGQGIEVQGDTAITSFGHVVSSNYVASHSSTGIILDDGVSQVKVFGNTVLDSNTSLRLQNIGAPGETDRVAYVYRNKFWSPAETGDQVFFHWQNYGPLGYYPVFWFYHNSFSGGNEGWYWNQNLANGTDSLYPTTFIVNNAINTHYIDGCFSGFMTNPDQVGGCDYNCRVYTGYPAGIPAAWESAHQIISPSSIWNTNSLPNWMFSPTSPLRDAALDVFSGTFSLKGTNYAALPSDGTAKIGSSWDIGAVEMPAALVVSNLTVNALSVAP